MNEAEAKEILDAFESYLGWEFNSLADDVLVRMLKQLRVKLSNDQMGEAPPWAIELMTRLDNLEAQWTFDPDNITIKAVQPGSDEWREAMQQMGEDEV